MATAKHFAGILDKQPDVFRSLTRLGGFVRNMPDETGGHGRETWFAALSNWGPEQLSHAAVAAIGVMPGTFRKTLQQLLELFAMRGCEQSEMIFNILTVKYRHPRPCRKAQHFEFSRIAITIKWQCGHTIMAEPLSDKLHSGFALVRIKNETGITPLAQWKPVIGNDDRTIFGFAHIEDMSPAFSGDSDSASRAIGNTIKQRIHQHLRRAQPFASL